MLNLTTALGRNGWQDWMLQRISAILIASYSIFLFIFWLLYGPSYAAWQTLFSYTFMCYTTVAVCLALIVHAWIGLWIICTDYMKTAAIRMFVFIIIYSILLFDLIWCIQILWGY